MLLLSQSKLTLTLKRKDFYISSFEGFFVIGILSDKKYIIFMEINCFELEIFYKHLRIMIAFLTNDEDIMHDLQIIKKLNGKNYTWKGQKNKDNEKQILIEISNKKLGSNYIELNEENCETILLSLPSIYFSCLQIHAHQKFFLLDLSKLNENSLLSLKENINEFQDIFKRYSKLFNEADLFDEFHLFLNYFKEIIIISEIEALQSV